MVLKTKVSPMAPVHILTIMEDDQTRLKGLKDKAWDTVKDTLVLKGFRRGMVPRALAEEKIGYDNVYEEVISNLVTQACIEAEEKIVGLGQVYIDSFDADKPALFRAEVWVEPEVFLTNEDGNKLYEGLTVEAPNVEVDDEEVEALIQRMREGAATTKSVEREAQPGDLLTIDYEGKLKSSGQAFPGGTSKDFKLILGSGTLLHEFEKQLEDVKAGSVVDVEISFPENYPAQGLAGQPAVFKTVIKDVSERTLPEVDDDLAKEMSYENLESMKAKLHEDLVKNKEQQSDMLIKNQLLLQLVQKVKIAPIPECMINDQIEGSVGTMLQNMGMSLDDYLKKAKITKQQLIEQHRNPAATDVRAKLVLKSIANAEGLEATEEEKKDLLEALFPDYAGKDQETLEKEINFDTLTLNVRVEKAVKHVREKAVLQETAKEAEQTDG